MTDDRFEQNVKKKVAGGARQVTIAPTAQQGSPNPRGEKQLMATDAPEEESPDGWEVPLSPALLRVLASIILVVVAGAALWPLLHFAYSSNDRNNPKDLGLPLIVLSCLAGAFAVHLPLRLIAQLLKKVGPIEFRALAKQKQEQVKATAPLEIRVQQLEERIEALLASTPAAAGGVPSPKGWKTVLANDELAKEVLRFLKDWPGQFFNATRIRGWGSKKGGFKAPNNPSVSEIDQRLQQLLAAGELRVKISKLGTTLYGAK